MLYFYNIKSCQVRVKEKVILEEDLEKVIGVAGLSMLSISKAKVKGKLVLKLKKSRRGY